MKSYQALTDEQLIQKLRDGDEKVMDYILNKYKPFVRKKANAMYLIGGETDDLIQEGMIGLFKAIRDYKEEREASFFHFAELCVTRQLYSAVEASNRKKHAPLNFYISFSATEGEEGATLEDMLGTDSLSNPEELVISQENQRIFLDRLRQKLSSFEREVLDLYLSGMNYQQIAEQMQKSPKSIDNALQRIKGKIR